ncbi:DUF2129 domain-containing protein [Lactobacillus sp. PV037]|uniref:DUF2129 domain-containing protein n=1 Tax=unclassified Lactobacillus TaxID=2620435 RepID=UPI00223F63BF|nr:MULTISPECIES: DUF2129 domain-containing protein [unclassified Lactobacillus]QNQ82437.1 DUF2129 domain-containing protein [Lactobacillus sp. PV012]QNQ83450.1 DUF2129 domain-containing protein [Lactobacillus sp. PV037]
MSLVYQPNDKDNLQRRISLIVWLKKEKDFLKLKYYGDIVYVSRAKKYAVLYVDQENIEKTVSILNHKGFTKKVEESRSSYLDFSPEYQEKTMREMKEKAEKLREENEDLRV